MAIEIKLCTFVQALKTMNIRLNYRAVLALISAFFILTSLTARAQEYVSPTTPPVIGRSPGVQVKLISANSDTKTYCLIFAPGDEVLSGLKEFAIKYHVTS